MSADAPTPEQDRAVLRLYNLICSLAHPTDDHSENASEDEAHDLIRELRSKMAELRIVKAETAAGEGPPAEPLPVRSTTELAWALERRAELLCGEKWEVPATAAMMREAATRLRSGASVQTVEPQVQALIERASAWQSKFFDYELGLRRADKIPTAFEVDAQVIMADLLTCVEISWASVPHPQLELQRIIDFCRQIARDGIQPSLAWFTETAEMLEKLGGASVPQPQTWQPIGSYDKATCPLKVLVCADNVVGEARQIDDGAYGTWYWANVAPYTARNIIPTHWMPLPSVPAQEPK